MEKTILKLHANGDFETIDTNIVQSGIAGNYSFNGNDITVPTIIEYPPEHLKNYFIKHTSVSGWVADFEQWGTPAGELNPVYGNDDRTSDFIDVSEWTDFTVRIVQENLVLHPYFRVVTYDSNKQYKGIFYEVAFQEYIFENQTLIATLKATLNDDEKYIRVSLNYYDNPNVITKITVNEGITSNDKYYLALEDMPTWVKDTGNPISIFPEGIVIKGIELNQETVLTIVKDGLLSYHHYKYGVTSTSWANLAPNRTQEAAPKRMTLTENGLINDKTYGSQIDLILPSEIYDAVTPFTLETRISATAFSAGIFTGWHSSDTPYPYGSITATRVNIDIMNETLTEVMTNSFETPFVTETFYTISVVYDGQYNLKLYVNGQYISEKNRTQRMRLGAINKIAFGESVRSTSTFKFIRLYNKALTAEEVLQNYNVGDEIGL